jgi:hypothetical protein
VRHVSYISGSCLSASEGSNAPRILHLQILPPCRGGGASVLHVSYNSGSCLTVGEGARAPCVLWLRILPPY